MKDNGPLMFPENGPSYHSGWVAANLDLDERAMAARAARMLLPFLGPAKPEDVIAYLTRLAAHYWSENGETRWKIIFEDYAADLAEYPLDIVLDGVARCRQRSKWWPKISELLDEMRGPLAERKERYRRLEVLAWQAENSNTSRLERRDPERCTAAQAEEVRRKYGMQSLGDALPKVRAE